MERTNQGRRGQERQKSWQQAKHAKLPLVAFSSLARIFGECSTIYSPPALDFILFY